MFKSGKIIFCLISAICLNACTNQAPTDGAKSSVHYDNIRPEITKWMQQPAILVFSKTQEWRHNEGIAGADVFFAQLSREEGYGLFTTVNSAVFNSEDLSRFDVVVFNNMTGDTLSPEQEKAFQAWLENGGAWIGIHGSGDSSHSDWDWYRKSLIGPTFIGHPMKPQFNVGEVVTLNHEHPIMEGLPDKWEHNEEWYSFDSRPQDHGLTPLAGLDETTIWPEGTNYAEDVELRMGGTPMDHPIMWTSCTGNGRGFYSALGHSDEAYTNPYNRLILKNSFKWVQKKSDLEGNHCPSNAKDTKD
jgi:type 1 glutamine amidotransferase